MYLCLPVIFCYAIFFLNSWLLSLLERRAADSAYFLFMFRYRQQYAKRNLVRSVGIVSQFRHRNIVTISNLVVIPLYTSQKDECIRVLHTITIPKSYQERLPVKIQTIVEVVERTLILIDKVGRNNRRAKTESRSTASILRKIYHSTTMCSKFNRYTIHAVETLVGTTQVCASYTSIPPLPIHHHTSAEVSIPLVVTLWLLRRRLVHKTLTRVNLIGKV